MSTSLAWDERYTEAGGYPFGEAPNAYLRSQSWRLRAGMRAVVPGDGGGRNGVWLAERGLVVTSLDWSAVGVARARDLAARRGVAMTAEVADVSRWAWPPAAFDCAAWIYLHLPPEDRAAATAGWCAPLPLGGSSSSNASPRRSRAAAPAGRRIRRCCGRARWWRAVFRNSPSWS